MKRRELLVAGAAAAIAGCSSDETGDDPASDADQEPLEENGTGPGNESDDIDPDPANETNNESDNETDDVEEEPDDTDDEAEKQRKRVAEKINTARGHVETALETYTSFGDGVASFTGVEAGDSVDAALVRRDLEDADTELDDVRDDALDDQQDAIAALDAAIEYIDLTLAIDARWTTVLDEGSSLRDEILTESVSAIESQRSALADAVAPIDNRADRIDADIDTDLVLEAGVVTDSEIQQKRQTIDDQRAAASALVDLADAWVGDDALPSWVNAVDEYTGGKWSSTWSLFYGVSEEFGSLKDMPPGNPALFGDVFSDLESLAGTVSDAAAELEESSRGYRSDSAATGHYYYERALQVLDDSDHGEELPSRTTLAEAEPPE